MKLFAALLAAGVALVAGPIGQASWSLPAAGQSAARAHVMPAGQVPSATVSGSNVTVTWAASVFAGGEPVGGYVVKRYNGVTGTPATTLAGCAGVVAALTCTENGVPAGTWRYSVTPAAGTWRGSESAQSTLVTVVA
jgi:hypothetical protein